MKLINVVMRKHFVLKYAIHNEYFVYELAVYNNPISRRIPHKMLRFKKRKVLRFNYNNGSAQKAINNAFQAIHMDKDNDEQCNLSHRYEKL